MTVWPPAQMLYHWATGDYVKHVSNRKVIVWLHSDGGALILLSSRPVSGLRNIILAFAQNKCWIIPRLSEYQKKRKAVDKFAKRAG